MLGLTILGQLAQYMLDGFPQSEMEHPRAYSFEHLLAYSFEHPRAYSVGTHGGIPEPFFMPEVVCFGCVNLVAYIFYRL